MPVVQMLHMERVHKLDGFKQQAECMRQAIELVEQGMTDMNLQVFACSVLSCSGRPDISGKLSEARSCTLTCSGLMPALSIKTHNSTDCYCAFSC